MENLVSFIEYISQGGFILGRHAKTRKRILSAQADQNIRFADIIVYLRYLGFLERVRGDHHILTHDDVVEIINLQPRTDGTAKPYQVRQVRALITQYMLGNDND